MRQEIVFVVSRMSGDSERHRVSDAYFLTPHRRLRVVNNTLLTRGKCATETPLYDTNTR